MQGIVLSTEGSSQLLSPSWSPHSPGHVAGESLPTALTSWGSQPRAQVGAGEAVGPGEPIRGEQPQAAVPLPLVLHRRCSKPKLTPHFFPPLCPPGSPVRPGAHPPGPASCPLPAHRHGERRSPYRLVALGWDSCCRIRLNCLFIILRDGTRPGEPFHSAVPAQHPSVTLGMGCPQPLGSPGPPRLVLLPKHLSPSLLLPPSLVPPFAVCRLVPSLVPPWGCPACFLFPSLGLLLPLPLFR